jgi:hypothetical protein
MPRLFASSLIPKPRSLLAMGFNIWNAFLTDGAKYRLTMSSP